MKVAFAILVLCYLVGINFHIRNIDCKLNGHPQCDLFPERGSDG